MKKLDRPVAQRILDFMDRRVAASDDPRTLGKPLDGPLGTLWRYRVGDFRVICEIKNGAMRVLVIRVGHRREVYR